MPVGARAGPDRVVPVVPSRMTLHRILLRHGLITPKVRRRPRRTGQATRTARVDEECPHGESVTAGENRGLLLSEIG